MGPAYYRDRMLKDFANHFSGRAVFSSMRAKPPGVLMSLI